MRSSRGPTFLVVAAFVAVMAFSFVSTTGRVDAATQTLDTGLVVQLQDAMMASSAALTSNTSETQGTIIGSVWSGALALSSPAVVVGSADVLGIFTTLGTSRGSLSWSADATLTTTTDGQNVRHSGLQLHKDQVLDQNVMTSAANMSNAAIGSTGTTISAVTVPDNLMGVTNSQQAFFVNIGAYLPTVFNGGLMFATLALAAARFLGKRRTDFLYGLGRRADHMMSMMGRTTTRAVISVVRFFGDMSPATTPSAIATT